MSQVSADGPRRVEVVEVGTRDGFQMETAVIPTAEKIRIIDALTAAGLRRIEATSFVSPRAVPQLADAAEVVAGIARPAGLVVEALAPNPKGAERALAAGVDEVVVFLSASESHNRANVNRSIDASLEGLAPIAELCRAAGKPFVGAIAVAFGCPFEGDVPPAQVGRLAAAFAGMGADRLVLGDTTGVATPRLVASTLDAVRAAAPDLPVALHFHNTRGLALVNVQAGLAAGVRIFESSIGGLGGCPFAPGATGNVSTEDLIHFLQQEGWETGVDLEALIAVALDVERLLGRRLPGQVMRAGPRDRLHPLEGARCAVG